MCLGWRFRAVLWKNDGRPLPWEQNPAASRLAHIWQLTRCFFFFYDGLWIRYLPSQINKCVAYLFCIPLYCWIFAKVSRLRAFSLSPNGKVLTEGRRRPPLRGSGSDSAGLYKDELFGSSQSDPLTLGFVCFTGTTMCSTTCWPVPVKRRGSPSTCSNLRNTTTLTRWAHSLCHTERLGRKKLSEVMWASADWTMSVVHIVPSWRLVRTGSLSMRTFFLINKEKKVPKCP